MATRTIPDPIDRLDRPIALEFAVVVGLVVLAYLWQRLLGAAWEPLADALPWSSGPSLVLLGLVHLGGFVAVAAVYARIRELDVGLERPTREDLPLVGLAVGAPAAMLALTALATATTEATVGGFTDSTYGEVPQLELLVLFLVFAPLLGAATYALVCQVLVQGTFARIVDGDAAALLTTLVAGFLLVETTGGLTTRPDRGHLLGAVLFVLALGLAVYATERVDRDWLLALAFLPAVAVVGVALLDAVAAIGSLAAGLFVVTNLVVLGVAALTYERTESLVVPVLAYLTVLVGTQLGLLLAQTSLGPW